MKELDQNIKTKIDGLIDKAMKNFNPQDIEASVDILKEAWESLPDKKEDWPESFLISKYITVVYFNAKKIQKAYEWAKIFNKSFVNRSYGESEFMLGKILFEKEELEEAKKWFAVADKKSEGRVWKGEKDMRYYKFYKAK